MTHFDHSCRCRRRRNWSYRYVLFYSVLAAGAWSPAEGQQVVVHPIKDGTLVDGDGFGPFDGVADAADWFFNGSSYDGSIALIGETAAGGVEYRVVWEFDLEGVAPPAPVDAVLEFTLRGAPIFPFPVVSVHVYAYAADLQETADDFSEVATAFEGRVFVRPSEGRFCRINVSDAVNHAILSGDNAVAFRFQIDPTTINLLNQAFIDATEADPNTKPRLLISPARDPIPGDYNLDGVLDLFDFEQFDACTSVTPLSLSPACTMLDINGDANVDILDFATFQRLFTPPPR